MPSSEETGALAECRVGEESAAGAGSGQTARAFPAVVRVKQADTMRADSERAVAGRADAFTAALSVCAGEAARETPARTRPASRTRFLFATHYRGICFFSSSSIFHVCS